MKQQARRDHYQEVTDRMVEALEQDREPWVRPWDSDKAGGPQAPFNPTTGKRYHGINVLLHGMDIREHFMPPSPHKSEKGTERRPINHYAGDQMVTAWGFILATEAGVVHA